MKNNHKVLVGLLTASSALFLGVRTDEGFTSKPVRPTQGDVPTIGHGTTVYPNGKAVTMHDKPISRQTADYYLKHHISKVEKQFKHSIPHVKLAQSEYDAYIDFVYQFGIGTFNQSSMRTNLLQGNYVQACKSLLKYKYVAGRDCSIRSNNCYGVYVRQNNRYEKCMEANQ
ncbi:glycoside hydrolase family protein [Acinetobacter pollinis]|uniref:Lysozyme n=1 Tax=Acinetobacter pollinis TaxID=2605270 RepID=A0ABU6DQ65_9GAMM|nr:glycoside hydrolase family protein [Acinetobacter pollinis]MEB5476008.1 glycoside hydrolase family protein [Acinetobacter pollinis]